MKFILGFLPTLPATLEERARERPMGHRTERWQKMFDEVIELSRMGEDLGFDIVSYPEHHLHSEGIEVGSVPQLGLYIALHTKHVKVGPIGYVLPGWNPLRLAVEIGWLDQLTKGRTIVGFARGYQHRWLNSMAQKIHVGALTGQADVDRTNRRAFEEVFEILQLGWRDEPFSFKGEFYEYPFPYEEGTPWPAHPWTAKYGAPGEVVGDRVRKISIVPKPYQKPHPPLFQAFSSSPETITWCAKRAITAMTAESKLEKLRDLVDIYHKQALEAGHKIERGNCIGVARAIYFGRDKSETNKLAARGQVGCYFRNFTGYFSGYEPYRFPEDEEKWPAGKVLLPESEWTVERVERGGYLWQGTPAEIRRKVDELIEVANPEYMSFFSDQGLLSLEECKKQLRTFGEEIIPHYR